MASVAVRPKIVNADTSYSEVAPQYADFIASSATDQVFAYLPALKALGPLKDKAVLDYGCGPGVFSKQMADEGARVVGVDVAADAIELAKKQLREKPAALEFHQIQSHDLSRLGEGRFDAATVNFVFCTIGDRAEIVRILQSLRKALKPGGKVFISDQDWEKSNGRDFINTTLTHTPNLRPGAPVLTVAKGSAGRPDLPLQDYYWPLSEYRAMLAEAGFQIVAVEEPIATTEDHPWLDELSHPPTLLITAQLPLRPSQSSDKSTFEMTSGFHRVQSLHPSPWATSFQLGGLSRSSSRESA